MPGYCTGCVKSKPYGPVTIISVILTFWQFVCAVTLKFITVPDVIARHESGGKVGLKN